MAGPPKILTMAPDITSLQDLSFTSVVDSVDGPMYRKIRAIPNAVGILRVGSPNVGAIYHPQIMERTYPYQMMPRAALTTIVVITPITFMVEFPLVEETF